MGEVVRAKTSATIVLVEGASDRQAVVALAEVLGIDFVAARTTVVSVGGVTNLRRHLAGLAQERVRPRVIGLFDVGETAYVRRAVEQAALGRNGFALASRGFFACEAAAGTSDAVDRQ